MKTYYLNNSGSRYVIRDKDNRNIQITFVVANSTFIRRVKYFKQYGFWAIAIVSLNGELTRIADFNLVRDRNGN